MPGKPCRNMQKDRTMFRMQKLQIPLGIAEGGSVWCEWRWPWRRQCLCDYTTKKKNYERKGGQSFTRDTVEVYSGACISVECFLGKMSSKLKFLQSEKDSSGNVLCDISPTASIWYPLSDWTMSSPVQMGWIERVMERLAIAFWITVTQGLVIIKVIQ